MIKMLYDIYGGMTGGFGGAHYFDTVECKDEDEATKWAYDLAWEEYESYVGFYGIRSWDEIYEELRGDTEFVNESELEDYANDVYREEVESWIDYWAEPHREEEE